MCTKGSFVGGFVSDRVAKKGKSIIYLDEHKCFEINFLNFQNIAKPWQRIWVLVLSQVRFFIL